MPIGLAFIMAGARGARIAAQPAEAAGGPMQAAGPDPGLAAAVPREMLSPPRTSRPRTCWPWPGSTTARRAAAARHGYSLAAPNRT